MFRKFTTLLLALCLLAWSSITPVHAEQGRHGFKEMPGKVVFQNLSIASTSSDTAVKKFSDTTFQNNIHFYLKEFLTSLVNSFSHLGGFIYRHPIYNNLTAQAP